jgi:hypothetical protein
MRWAQLTLVEDDPGKFDLAFWLDYFRRSLPLPRGFLHTNQALILRAGQVTEPVGVRVLSWYPATSA